MRILHIAAHMGGGIGSAYVGLGTCGQEQSILLLEPPQDRTALSRVAAAGFRILQGADNSIVEQELRQADAVVFSWHHHPAMTRFFRQMPSIPMRSIVWIHVSGNYFPEIPAGFVAEFDEVMFATPFSLELPQIRALGSAYRYDRCSVVYGLNDLSRFSRLKREPHRPYTIGYVGTLEFCKLHPNFIEFCAEVKIPNVRFLMVGAAADKERLLELASLKGIADRFQFCGYMADVAQALAQMDAFGYLLNPQHFGATENALLEAMAAGLPIIALDQCVERRIIRGGKTGLLIHSPQEYGVAVQRLYADATYAAQLGAAAQADILKGYNIRANRREFLTTCKRALERNKRILRLDGFFSGGPADWFLSCVGEDRQCFLENRAQDAGQIFRERTKGSPIHYYSYFCEDKRLRQWVEQLTH